MLFRSPRGRRTEVGSSGPVARESGKATRERSAVHDLPLLRLAHPIDRLPQRDVIPHLEQELHASRCQQALIR